MDELKRDEVVKQKSIDLQESNRDEFELDEEQVDSIMMNFMKLFK